MAPLRASVPIEGSGLKPTSKVIAPGPRALHGEWTKADVWQGHERTVAAKSLGADSRPNRVRILGLVVLRARIGHKRHEEAAGMRPRGASRTSSRLPYNVSIRAIWEETLPY